MKGHLIQKKDNKMNILITGGAGFMGSHLVDKLSKNRDNKITIFDNFYNGRKENIERHLKNKSIELIEGDIRNDKDIEKIGKVDIIYHLAAQSNVMSSFFDPDYALSTNIKGTYKILRFASESKGKKFIFLSSREVYGNPDYVPVDEKHPLKPVNIYGITKMTGEMLCNFFKQNHGLKVSILRVANVYGSRDKNRVIPIFLNNIKNKEDLILFGGKQVLDFVWIDDVINSILQVSGTNKFIGETVNIGTGVGITIENLAKKLIKMTNSKSKIIKKKHRKMEVKAFIAKSTKFRINPLKLDSGLKKMIEESL